MTDVDRLAQLARLALTDDERALYAAQLAEFLSYAEQVQQLDSRGVEPTSHATSLAIALRPDVEAPCLPRDVAIAAGPEASREVGLFKVPRVIG